jgi:hypothetical protein
VKTKTLSWWKKDTQTKFNALIREKGYCEWCGSTVNQLHCSHILSVGAHPNLRFDILNVCCHCSYCHRFKWHDNPLGGMEWFINKYPERFKYLQAVKNNYKKWTIPDLQEIQEYIKNKDLKKLITFPS